MKQKKQPEPTPQPSGTSTAKLIEVKSNNNDNNHQPKNPLRQSWVWNHLKESNDPNIAVCQVVTKSGHLCGKKLKKDKSGSTKNLHSHLSLVHHLVDPKLTKKMKTNHIDMEKWSQSGQLKPKVRSFCIFLLTKKILTFFMARLSSTRTHSRQPLYI